MPPPASPTIPFKLIALLTLLLPGLALGGFSVDERPNETAADPGDVFYPVAGGPLGCEMDDGDGSCPSVPSFNVPNPGDDQDPTFDLDALSVDDPLEVCPVDPGYVRGILFSFDDGDPGPGVGPPDNATELFFYDHCLDFAAIPQSYYTTLTEATLNLMRTPPPTEFDDDVDAYTTRLTTEFYSIYGILFSSDNPSNGGLPGAVPEAHIWKVSPISPAPSVWATPRDIGVPDEENCDIDGISRIYDPDFTNAFLFTTDAEAPCGLDPGDIYISDRGGNYWLFADDVNDLKIARDEDHDVDIDALAINWFGDFQVGIPYDPPPPPPFKKAAWPNYAPSGMPDFSQYHAQWPLTWCGPTAVADSLWWFDSEMECDRDRTAGQNAEIEPNDTCDLANTLGEVPYIPGFFAGASDPDWYFFDLPDKSYRTCRVTVSTCAMRQPGDEDTILTLYDDCDSSGTPSGLIATNDNGCPDPADLQSEITVELSAGNRYWVLVEPGFLPAGAGAYNLSLGIDCYPMVERYPETPDDHSDHNPSPLIDDLRYCMNTDDVLGTGGGHSGTQIPDMDICIDDWLATKGLIDMYEKVVAPMPLFEEVQLEIERSEDVVLLLGFYWSFDQGAHWIRCGGHYVTAAGVNAYDQSILISDPGLNNAEPPPDGTAAPGHVLGPNHTGHAPATSPPPHDDTLNASHDWYLSGPPLAPGVSMWALPHYATNEVPTTCGDVADWCMGDAWGQNPPEPPAPQEPCVDPTFPVTTEVEFMVDVSPKQTPLCIFLDATVPWPDSLRVRKTPCDLVEDAIPKDLIRGKLCNLRISPLPTIDLGHVQCLYDDVPLTEFPELSPDDTRCMGAWFYLIRESGDTDYGFGRAPFLMPRLPESGGCP